MRTNADLTLYNRYVEGNVELYQRTQILGVSWENRKARNVLASGGNIAADQAVIYIPLERGADFVAPKAWMALADKEGKWTLVVGDYVVKGLVEDEIHGPMTSPPLPAFTITKLKAKYDDVLAISSVDTMDLGSTSMRHWQIGAK